MSALVSTASKTIDGRRYEITTWAASTALDRYTLVIELLGADLLELVLRTGAQSQELLASEEVLGRALVTLARNAREIDGGLAGAMRAILSGVSVEIDGDMVRVADDFDRVFTGSLKQLVPVAAEVLRANFTAG